MGKYDRYYLMGFMAASEDGDDEMELDEFDVPRLGKQVLGGQSLYDVTKAAIDAEVKKSSFSDHKEEWLADKKNRRELKIDKADPDQAYAEYLRGWTDASCIELQIAIGEGLEDIAGDDDDDDDEEDGEEDEEDDN